MILKYCQNCQTYQSFLTIFYLRELLVSGPLLIDLIWSLSEIYSSSLFLPSLSSVSLSSFYWPLLLSSNLHSFLIKFIILFITLVFYSEATEILNLELKKAKTLRRASMLIFFANFFSKSWMYGSFWKVELYWILSS